MSMTFDPSMNFDPFGLLPPRRWPVAWAPNNSAVRNVMERLANRSNLQVEGFGFATEKEMEEFVMASYNAGVEPNNTIDSPGGNVSTNPFVQEDTFPKDIHVNKLLIIQLYYLMQSCDV